MTTLISSAAADALDNLLTPADWRDKVAHPALDRHRFRGTPAHAELELSAPAKGSPLAVSMRTGNLLYLLARAHRARVIIEFGTSYGMTTICLAAALQDNEGGKRGIVIGAESEPENDREVDTSLDPEGLGDLVEIREGNPLLTLRTDIPRPVDLVFLDGAKHLYLPVLELLEPHLRAGCLVVANNAGPRDGYLPYVRTSGKYVSTAAADDVEISVKIRPATPSEHMA